MPPGILPGNPLQLSARWNRTLRTLGLLLLATLCLSWIEARLGILLWTRAFLLNHYAHYRNWALTTHSTPDDGTTFLSRLLGSRCGAVRKYPAVILGRNQTMRVVWELNCPAARVEFHRAPMDQRQPRRYRPWPPELPTLVEPVRYRRIEDTRHLYEVVLEDADQALPGYTIYYWPEVDASASMPPPPLQLGPYALPCPHIRQPRARTCTPIRFAGVSDNQFGATAFLQVLARLLPYQPHAMFHVGDAVQRPFQLQDWQTDFFDVLGDTLASRPLLFARGNHDEHNRFGGIPQWVDVYLGPNVEGRVSAEQPTWFAISLGTSRWIILNSNHDSDQQLHWLESELSSDNCQQAHFRIVMVHIPPFLEYWDPESWERGESEWGKFVHDKFVPLFERYRVHLVISGHQHNYQRGQRNGVTYVIMGGAGGSLESQQVQQWNMYEVTWNLYHFVIVDLYEKELYWRTIGVDGALLDEWRIQATGE